MSHSDSYSSPLEDMARYAGLLLASAEGLGRGFFCPLGQKRAYYADLAHFWCPVVTLVTFSSNRSNFERDPNKKYPPKIPKKSKIQKM